MIKLFIGQDQPQINCPSEFNGAGKIDLIYYFLGFWKKPRKSNAKNLLDPV